MKYLPILVLFHLIFLMIVDCQQEKVLCELNCNTEALICLNVLDQAACDRQQSFCKLNCLDCYDELAMNSCRIEYDNCVNIVSKQLCWEYRQ